MEARSREDGGARDPRLLRDLLERSCALSRQHRVPTVVVGVAGREGELLVPELFRFLESSLRVEDAIFRLTRERAVLFLADVDEAGARRVVERLVRGFEQYFPSARSPVLHLGFYELPPSCGEVRLKDVLPTVFPAAD